MLETLQSQRKEQLTWKESEYESQTDATDWPQSQCGHRQCNLRQYDNVCDTCAADTCARPSSPYILHSSTIHLNDHGHQKAAAAQVLTQVGNYLEKQIVRA